ncbi:hypothetical protein [Microbacterium sp. Leaf151]|uniref:hypothetical protein n=1 Tax=Microbacterium sp. Leaf151 TaxID=1736276 RepID=UPI0006FB1423|nr:hypothetical protein [Microbacterium sp. Leaf151]KQR25781.1 hypothetical protein ASF76_00290 [Microbacterium sp. Leaf151]
MIPRNLPPTSTYSDFPYAEARFVEHYQHDPARLVVGRGNLISCKARLVQGRSEVEARIATVRGVMSFRVDEPEKWAWVLLHPEQRADRLELQWLDEERRRNQTTRAEWQTRTIRGVQTHD